MDVDVMTTNEQREALDPEMKQMLSKIANTIRDLSIDAVQKANSGHPGMPMGCAELGAYLYGCALRHNPKNSKWLNRDRLILSAGHGSMWLYSCLHLAGFNVSMEAIKNFRQLHSGTPGHPEEQDTDGVETTTGPLGQGMSNAVGTALGLKMLAARFNTRECHLFDNKVFALMGDGCVMEGVTSEASSLAGHLQLDNLIVIYDSNHVSLDGPLSESCSEDTLARYRAYGWEVYEIGGYDFDAMHNLISGLRENQKRPCLIIADTVIGKGSPNKSGTHKVHGAPLGEEEVQKTKEALGLPQEPFFVPQAVYDYFDKHCKKQAEDEKLWGEMTDAWAKANPERFQEFEFMLHRRLPGDLEAQVKEINIASPIAGRKASSIMIQELAKLLPYLVSGSADLSCSDLTLIQDSPIVSRGHFEGRNIKFGVREFGMATMATGMAHTGMLTPVIGTFLTFSDYMRNAIRLASMMKCPVIYQFTHDSVFLGEDGPTHQPVEHLASLRAMPNLHVIRPGDAHEVKMAWIAALYYAGPTALILSRQNIPEVKGTDVPFAEGVGRGAYILKKEASQPDYTLIATGSELALAVDVARELEKIGKDVRVISMPCWELFEQQNQEYKDSVLGGNLGQRVSVEAGVEQGWHKYIGADGIAICMEGYGASAPYRDLVEEFGFTVESIMERIL